MGILERRLYLARYKKLNSGFAIAVLNLYNGLPLRSRSPKF